MRKVEFNDSSKINVDDVTDEHLVVLVTKQRIPCLLVKEADHYAFMFLDREGRRTGNNYSGAETERSPAELIHRLENVGTFYVFDTVRELGEFLMMSQSFESN